MSLLSTSTSRFPHSKFVIQIPGLSKLRHFHSVKQQPTGARTYTKRCYLSPFSRILGQLMTNNVNGKTTNIEIIIVVIIIVNRPIH